MADVTVIRRADAPVQRFDWGELHWFANAQIGNSPRMTVGKCIIRPGCQNPRHHHPNCDEVLHVLAGTISHSVGDDRHLEMTPGDTIAVPAGVVHNARNIGTVDAVLMVSFSSGVRETRNEQEAPR